MGELNTVDAYQGSLSCLLTDEFKKNFYVFALSDISNNMRPITLR